MHLAVAAVIAVALAPVGGGDRVLDVEPRVLDVEPRVLRVEPRVVDLVVPDGDDEQIELGTDVLFAFGSAELPPDGGEQLSGVAARIAEVSPSLVRVTGHTDGIGDDASNLTLSEQRAAAVLAALTAAVEASGAAAPAFESAGRGETEPLLPEMTPAGADIPANRARNRRVTVELVQ